MPSHKAAATNRGRAPAGPVFTVDRANRALILVRRVAADIVARYRELMQLRARQNDESEIRTDLESRALQQRIDACVDVLGQLHRELSDVGCVLKDWRTGLIDFPAVRKGQRVWLCWRLGEPTVAHWHELHDGFSGRRPIKGEPDLQP